MIMNLFSSFNPSSSPQYSMNWITLTTIIIMPSMKFWAKPSMTLNILPTMVNKMNNQLYPLITSKMKHNMIILTSTMMSIFLMNFISLYPYSYPWTSQLSVSLSMALPLWLGCTLTKLIKVKKMMSHMVPSDTPTPLIPLMAMIELISLMIQPITLSVRLTANITAGHILMSLISTAYNNMILSPMIIPIHMMLSTMELCVSIIQAYVFTMLITMYMNP